MLRNLISPPSRHFHIIQFILKLKKKKSVNLIVKVKTRQLKTKHRPDNFT